MANQLAAGDTLRAKGQGAPSWVRPLLFAAISVAALMRLWGIDYGLPYEGITYDQITWEEVQEVHRAFKLGAGEYTWMFGKGGLYLILFVEYGIYFLVSYLLGWVSNPREFAMQVLENRTPVFMMGRLTVLAMGLATYAVIYAVGKRLYDWRVGLVAAVIGCFAYFHGVFSTVINVDIGMTLAFWTSILAYLRYEETLKTRFLIFAGVLGAISIAFKLPGAVVLPLVFIATITAPGKWRRPLAVVRENAIIMVVLLASLTVIAPEWITSIGRAFVSNFSSLLGLTDRESIPVSQMDLDSAISTVTIVRTGAGFGYLEQLASSYNIAISLAALVGIAIGVLRRNRWDMILGGFTVIFVTVMSLSDRTQSEHYLLVIMPALWLLSGRAIAALSRLHWVLAPAALVCVIAASTVALVRHDVEKSHPDTRIVAKEWIETNLPSGSRILMDGMQYRYIPSPPLNPNEKSLSRKVSRASEEGEHLGRGLSSFALKLYQQALSNVKGPKYDLQSTTYGLELESPSYYVDNCFDYIVTSSYITDRYAPGRSRRELFPNVARNYDALTTDPRLRVGFRVEPKRWKSIGPAITVYEIIPDCKGE